MSERKKMKRGAVRRADAYFVGAWMPKKMVETLDGAVVAIDSDRSKFTRDAIKEKLARMFPNQPLPTP